MEMTAKEYRHGIGKVLTTGRVWGLTAEEQALLLGKRLPDEWTLQMMDRNIRRLQSTDVEDRIPLVVRLKAAVAKIEPRAEKQRHWLRVFRPDLECQVKDLLCTGHLSDLAKAVAFAEKLVG